MNLKRFTKTRGILLKRILPFLLACSLFSLASCGQFTNIPAQIKLGNSHDKDGESLVATVSYQVSQNEVKAEIKNPKLVLEGEAGSIGATFDGIKIRYIGASLN